MKKITIIFLFLLIISRNVSAVNPPQKKLVVIDSRIAHVKADIHHEQNQQQQLSQQLKNLEISTSHFNHTLTTTDKQLNKTHLQLTQLQIKERQQQTQLKLQKISLAKEMRAAYMLGRQTYIKLILNQEDPERLSRVLTYYRYIQAQRMQTIAILQNTLIHIEQYQTEIKNHYSYLTLLKQQQLYQQQNLEHLQDHRKMILTILDEHIQTKKQQLNQLLHNKQHLEQVIHDLEIQFKTNFSSHEDFAAQKGKLAWPTKGVVLNNYGTPIEQSELKWTGVLIKAPLGQPVRAVASGQVIFAKWLPGYGLLIIINHGHGYMTLYGRNEFLYKKEGAYVQAGERIATVGNTGGYEKPALYFAIRKNARPLNPGLWCHKS